MYEGKLSEIDNKIHTVLLLFYFREFERKSRLVATLNGQNISRTRSRFKCRIATERRVLLDSPHCDGKKY